MLAPELGRDRDARGGTGKAMVERLTEAERERLAQDLPGWQVLPDRDAIAREWRFPDFVQAWGFVSRVALLAQQADHHPEWWNAYGKVRIVLTTHDAGGLSARDVALARSIDALGAG